MRIHHWLWDSFLLLTISYGCVTVKDEIFLRNVEVEGSLGQTPIHITDGKTANNMVHISPYISLQTQRSYTASLENQYSPPVPDSLPDFQQTGLRWNLPRTRFGLDIDYAASNTVSLMGGISTSIGPRRQFLEGYGGIGLVTRGDEVGCRLDFGLRYFAMSYRAATVIVRTTIPSSGSQTRERIHFLDRGEESHLNFFGSLTINSANAKRIVDYFLHLGVSPQTLTGFRPRETVTEYPFGVTRIVSDLRAESSVVWLTVVPGVYFSVSNKQRVVLGMQLLKDVQSESSDPRWLVAPMLQLDWTP